MEAVVVRVLWAIAIVSALALGISVFATVATSYSMRTQAARISAVAHQEAVDRKQIAMLQAELRAERALGTQPGPP